MRRLIPWYLSSKYAATVQANFPNYSYKHLPIIHLLLWWPVTGIIRTTEGFGPCSAFLTVCSCASPSPAVGLLCDGACRKGIGGKFHTLGAAWWGVGRGLMNRVHLAKRRGPQASLVQTRFTDQRGNPRFIQSSSHPVTHSSSSYAFSSSEFLEL